MRFFNRSDIYVIVVTVMVVGGLGVFLVLKVPIGLADPKPKLPPLEDNRVHHPKGFSIIAPQGWQFSIETTKNDRLDRIFIQPDIDARWSPKLIVRLLAKGKNPYYPQDPNDYQQGKYLEFNARIYEGLLADYHGWHAVFSHEGKRYDVLLMLPHGHGPPRYDKVPDYWWPFLNSFRIEPNTE